MSLTFDSKLLVPDTASILAIARATKVFPESEIAKLDELLNVAWNNPDYLFQILRDEMGNVQAFSCCNQIIYTEKRYELLWIVVAPNWHGQGIAKDLLTQTENLVRDCGGKMLYIETSNISIYDQARAFYVKSGYEIQATLLEYYDTNDHKIIYRKILSI